MSAFKIVALVFLSIALAWTYCSAEWLQGAISVGNKENARMLWLFVLGGVVWANINLLALLTPTPKNNVQEKNRS